MRTVGAHCHIADREDIGRVTDAPQVRVFADAAGRPLGIALATDVGHHRHQSTGNEESRIDILRGWQEL